MAGAAEYVLPDKVIGPCVVINDCTRLKHSKYNCCGGVHMDKFHVNIAHTARSRDVSDMPLGRPPIGVAALSQKLLPYNIIAFKHFKIKTI